MYWPLLLFTCFSHTFLTVTLSLTISLFIFCL
jgi:hypothetical protein